MKGIILSGGSGSRLYPLTKVVSKQLLPLYDKPMIYYPLSILMQANIKDILIITTQHDQELYKRLLGDGSDYGITISYTVQEQPNGLAEAFILGEEFIGNDSVALVLGDNVLIGDSIYNFLNTLKHDIQGSVIFGYKVSDPKRFGVIEFNNENEVVSLEEKPLNPKSNYAAIGLYLYDNKVVQYAKQVTYSVRGELEITDINKMYLENKKLSVKILEDNSKWFDTGTIESLYEASSYIRAQTLALNKSISDLNEIAKGKGWI